ncbi:glutamate ligase domain-containing protein, partial [Winogradskyella sp.]|uniref:glutamate ligase domain-containing protein n=2 Tax=Winogradskyella TaxID=286104 RepID=UPI003AA8F6FF
TAHNKEGLSYTMQQLQAESYNKLHIVFGVVSDKDLDGIISLLPKQASYYFCKPNVQRGQDEELLKEYFLSKGFTGNSYSSVNEALHTAKLNANTDDLIYVGGSTFVVAEVL